MPLTFRSLTTLLDPASRVVIADPQSPSEIDWLHSHAQGSCIVFSDSMHGGDVRSYSDTAVLKNNANLLLLDGGSTHVFLRVKTGPDLHMTLIPLWRFLVSGRFMLAMLRYFIRRRIALPGLYKGYGRWWIGFDMINFKRNPKAYRQYMPDTWSLDDLARKLQAAGHAHVVINVRDDGLPTILTSDEGYAFLCSQFAQQIGIQAVNIYSASGEAALFPLRAAQEILAAGRASPREAFLIAAYDAVCFRGLASGLPSRHLQQKDESPKARQFRLDIESKARAAGIDAACLQSLEQLADTLQENGWLPARDTLSLYSRKNVWLRGYFFADEGKDMPPGLAVFLVREIAEEWQAVDQIEAELVSAGFTVLEKQVIPKETRVSIGNRIRGGNWGAGAWKASGGLPACALVLADPAPKTPKAFKRSADIKLDNTRIMHKHVIRDRLNKGRPRTEQANVLHTSDNTTESLDYIEVLFGEEKKNEIYNRFLSLIDRGAA